MKPHTVFLRAGCVLPEQSDLLQTPFCDGWTEAIGTFVTELDFGIRGAGWHFMWIAGSHASRGLGRTPDAATHRAIVRGLKQVKERFNAAELGSIQFRSFLGFHLAKVTLHTRHIQKQASLDRIEKPRLRELPAH